jgi:NAD(P)-dependent dehydrogenase (short-subunit alcohol dehydrogenase family)
VLRAGLLEGVAVLFAGASGTPPSGALAVEAGETCAALGASVSTCSPDADLPEPEKEVVLDAAVASAASEQGRLDLLAVDGAGLFAEALARGGGGHAALRACVDGAWNATRAVVNHAFLQAAEPRGRVVYLAPPPDAGEHAGAACAGLDNLARTLSIEWARHRITTVTIAPGTRTMAGEVAALVAYLASPAGAYFSGCLLDLRGARST